MEFIYTAQQLVETFGAEALFEIVPSNLAPMDISPMDISSGGASYDEYSSFVIRPSESDPSDLSDNRDHYEIADPELPVTTCDLLELNSSTTLDDISMNVVTEVLTNVEIHDCEGDEEEGTWDFEFNVDKVLGDIKKGDSEENPIVLDWDRTTMSKTCSKKNITVLKGCIIKIYIYVGTMCIILCI